MNSNSWTYQQWPSIKIYIHQLCVDIVGIQETRQGVIDDNNGWLRNVRDIVMMMLMILTEIYLSSVICIQISRNNFKQLYGFKKYSHLIVIIIYLYNDISFLVFLYKEKYLRRIGLVVKCLPRTSETGVILKTQKIVLDSSLLSIISYISRSKVEQSRESSNRKWGFRVDIDYGCLHIFF